MTAHSAQEALGHAVTSEFDLITLDTVMPGLSGLEILGVLRSTSPHAAMKEALAQEADGVTDQPGEVHVAGELLPGVEVVIPQTVVKKLPDGEMGVGSAYARMVISEGPDEDHLVLALEDTQGRQTTQTVEAFRLHAAAFRLHKGRISWQGRSA